MVSVILVLVFLAVGATSQYTCTLSLEAENGRAPGARRMSRSNASGRQAVLLYRNNQLVHDDLDFRSTDNTCSLQSFSIRYSNDGKSDRIEAFLNRTSLGTVTTFAKSNYGREWNVFHTASLAPSEVTMYDGEYAIRLSVVDSDLYGVEIDVCTLQFECSNGCPPGTSARNRRSRELNSDRSVESDDSGHNKGFQLSVGEIVGMVGVAVGVVVVIVAVVGSVIAAKKFRQRNGYAMFKDTSAS